MYRKIEKGKSLWCCIIVLVYVQRAGVKCRRVLPIVMYRISSTLPCVRTSNLYCVGFSHVQNLTKSEAFVRVFKLLFVSSGDISMQWVGSQ